MTPRPDGKVAMARLVGAVSDTRVKLLWTACPSIGTRSLLYAFANLKRVNQPKSAQLMEVASVALTQAEHLLASVEDAIREAGRLRAEEVAAAEEAARSAA